MKKNFIPYKESIAIKEIGFDEPCFGYFDPLLGDYTIMNSDCINPKPILFNHNSSSIVVSAPLYQQVFDWFEEQGLYSYISRSYAGGKYEYEFFIDGHSGLFGFQSKKLAEQGCIRSLIAALRMNKTYMMKLNRDNKLNELGI